MGRRTVVVVKIIEFEVVVLDTVTVFVGGGILRQLHAPDIIEVG